MRKYRFVPFANYSTNNWIIRILFYSIMQGFKNRFLMRPEFGKTSFTKVVELVDTSLETCGTQKSEFVCESYDLRKFGNFV